MENNKKIMKLILRVVSLIMIILYTMYYYFSRGVIANLKDFLMNGDEILGVVNATNFSKISGGFSIGYSLMQPIGGYLLDKFGIKLIYPLLLIFASIANFFFVNSSSISTMVFYRYLIGGFFCIASTGSMKYISIIWHKHFTFIFSLSKFLMCFASAIAASTTIKIYMNIYGWRKILHMYSLLGIIFAIVLYLSLYLVLNKKYNDDLIPPIEEETKSPVKILDGLKYLFKKEGFWWMSLFSLGSSSVAYVLMDGWGNSLLALKFPHMSMLDIISPATMNMYGNGIGHLYNIFAKKLKLKLQMIIYGLVGLFSLLSIIYFDLSLNGFLLCCFLLGFTCSSQNLGFRWVQENVSHRYLGLGFSILNFMCMFFGCAVVQKLTGYILDIIKNRNLLNGMTYYNNYTYGDLITMFKFLIIPAVLCILSIFFIKDEKK
jgi:MFS family permease